MLETKKQLSREVASDKETTNKDRYYFTGGEFSGTIYTEKGEFVSKKIKVTIEEA